MLTKLCSYAGDAFYCSVFECVRGGGIHSLSASGLQIRPGDILALSHPYANNFSLVLHGLNKANDQRWTLLLTCVCLTLGPTKQLLWGFFLFFLKQRQYVKIWIHLRSERLSHHHTSQNLTENHSDNTTQQIKLPRSFYFVHSNFTY